MNKNTVCYLKKGILSLLIIGLAACKHDDEDNFTFNGLDDSYTIERFEVLTIPANVSGNITWSVNDAVVSQNSELEFISPAVGTYPLTLKIENNGNTYTYHSKIIVEKEEATYTRYISKVLEYRPAAGQFMHEIPEYEPGFTASDMLQKVSKSLIGSTSSDVSLGGFGGYVVFGFDHTIPNMNGRDFKILGNAFFGNAAVDPRSGSCEPGIIMVAYDRNKNGKPDDNEWYEIAGSEHFKNTTIRDYSITYFKPDENKTPVPGTLGWDIDIEYIKWKDNLGNNGFKTRNMFHLQSYYPLWYSDASITFTGTRLKDNFYDQSGNGSYWVGKSYEYGYADNAPNTDEASNIDISWAVDRSGRYVKLPGIDFVKVYTGINQEAGRLGEVSTEVSGAYDLHFK